MDDIVNYGGIYDSVRDEVLPGGRTKGVASQVGLELSGISLIESMYW